MLNAKDLFPGAIRAISVFYDESSLGLVINDLDLLNSNPTIRIVENSVIDPDKLQQLRQQKLRYSWLNSPFTKEKKHRDQLEISTEYENHTLLLRFPTRISNLNDLLFIFFKNEEQLFRFTSRSSKLSTDLKQSIASVYVRSLDIIRKQIESDNRINETLSKNILSIEEEEKIKQAKEEEKASKKRLFYMSLVTKLSRNLMANSSYTIDWTDEAIAKLIEQSPTIDALEKQIENTLIVAVNESLSSIKQISIKERHLASSLENTTRFIKKAAIDDSYKKTYLLLDRYEKAAMLVLHSQLSLTGSNLGKHLTPSVSAPAISDAIRKHSQKITYLLREYPNRWEILRKQFRPIQNKVHYTFNDDQLAS